MSSDSSCQTKNCDDCVNQYPEQTWVRLCIYGGEEYGTPCDKHETEREEYIRKLEEKRDRIVQELDALYDSSSTTEKST